MMDNLKSKLNQGKILTLVVIEVIGSPKEHVDEALNLFIKKLKTEKDFEIANIETFPAEPKDKMFSAFTEVEILFNDLRSMLGFCMDYTPSSIEIIKPENMNVPCTILTHLMNDFVGQMHKLGLSIKEINAQNIILRNSANKLIKNIIKLSVAKTNGTDIAKISKLTGINEGELKIFLDVLIKDKEIEIKDNLYKLTKRDENGNKKAD